ncbi:hypothetical protein [Serratia nevei]|uniref:hypothetical protein n=1 Tax=Serratia nevei TaxID=2703794 RepID=UPI0006DD1704|nr:hypothetical protein AN699_0214345 [Serratia marcescens]OCN21788.1 hypothetical protein AN701_0214200 [Serratia marcescens]OCN64126.1 hypothetical protein AN664_0214230 [Serratia marcescens]OCN67336.1 hypothetical protein AN665_0211385 [Serratia marcescens]OCO54518.1 hypothetical protein AN686_0219775 [Serratia marcescens]
MYFLDNNSGVNAMPPIAPVNSTAVRWFTEGSGSLPPSWPGMDWFNIIQAELIGVLTAAGMSPDKARVDQLAAAIKSIIGSDALLKKNYLSEIKEAGAAAQKSARDNLGLGTAATKNVGTATGNVMEVGAFGLGGQGLVLSEATDAALMKAAKAKGSSFVRSNARGPSVPVYGAGFYSTSQDTNTMITADYATANVVVMTTRDADADAPKVNVLYGTANKPTAADTNAADMRNNFAARMGVSRVLSGGNKPTSPGVWSVENSQWAAVPWGSILCTTNSSDLSSNEGQGKFLHYLQLSHEAGGKPGLRAAVNVNGTFSGWQQVLMSYGGTMSGPLTTPYVASTPNVMPEGAGAFSDQLNRKAPFYQPNWQWPVTSGDLYVPIAKGVATRQGQGYPSAVSFGYLLSGTPSFAQACIHVKGDNADFNWRFDANSGNFYCPGGVYAAGAIFHVDGNITGNIWGGYLSNWLNNQFVARDNNINTRATWDYVNQNFVRDIRLASRGEIITDGALTEAPFGAVITGGNGNEGNQVGIMLFRYLQKNVNGNWYTVAYA